MQIDIIRKTEKGYDIRINHPAMEINTSIPLEDGKKLLDSLMETTKEMAFQMGIDISELIKIIKN